VFDKENSIEFLLDLVHYIYMQSNPNPVLLSHASLWVNLLLCICWYYKLKEKKKKRNNDLANLPSHDISTLTILCPSSIYILNPHKGKGIGDRELIVETKSSLSIGTELRSWSWHYPLIVICPFLRTKNSLHMVSYYYFKYKGTTIYRTIDSSMWWSVPVHRPSQFCI